MMGNGDDKMPAIEYGIDGSGRKVAAINAVSGRSYKCYYCKEEIHVRKGAKRRPYFAHSPISNRTPQQMACEGYKGHGTGDGYIGNNEDRICVFNGGVPLHLIEVFPERYELIAMFPPLSNKTMKQVEDLKGKVRIVNDGGDQVFSAWNFRRYKVLTSSPWIYVKPDNFEISNEEIKRKWFWGIRGIDLDNDLFRVDSSGGVRVGQLANIVIGKEYLFVHKWGNLPNGRGLRFEKKGKFSFPNGESRKKYDVYSVTVTARTDDAIAYIQQKGYQLIDKSDELIPMWPPAVLEGKELIYHDDDKDAFIYHHKEANQEVFCWGNYEPYQISEKDNVLKCSTLNKTLLLSDYSFNAFAKEIRFVLTHDRGNFSRDRRFEYEAALLFDDGRRTGLSAEVFNESFLKPIILEANYGTTAISVRDNYVLRSTSKRIDELSKRDGLIFLYEPFGSLRFDVLIKEKKEKSLILTEEKTFNYEELVEKLYHCHSAMTETNIILDRWIEYAKLNSENLAKVLLRWKNQGKMPIKALMILDDMEKLIR